MGKTLSLGARLRYPITITKLLKSPGDSIKKQEPVLQYSFTWMKEVGDPLRGETWQEEQTTIADWDSPAEGVIKKWRIKENMPIQRDTPCMEIEEACGHEIQFQGLCALCGKDMTEVSWASEQVDTQRATINMTHDQTSLMVSENLAARAEHDTQRRLLKQRKLSLVVDLDQTIIHACIEPTIGEWQRDSSNPNYEAVKEVKSFQLNDDGPRGIVNGCWYYIKMRPGLAEFLEKISELYELHVYTMGTRAYALNIAKIVDPQQKLFGNRVISRDENGSMISKSLQRLFPVSTDMVVIIDDRADVWPNNRPNLIKVTPYDFFKGIGDINSSFLPKRQDILPAPTPVPNGATSGPVPIAPMPTPAATTPVITPSNVGVAVSKVSALEELAGMSSGDDKALQRIQTEEQERSLEKQITDRPLLHMQEELDKEDDEKGQSPEDEADMMAHHSRQHVLRDDDEELFYLQQHLTNLHTTFYQLYDEKRANREMSPPRHSASSSHGHNSSRRKSHDDGVDLSMVPDVGAILDAQKAKVLQGTVIVLSGLVPLGLDVLQSEIGLQARSFGTEIHTKISKRVTHLVISTSRPRTQKVRQAAKIPHIKIVNQNWLADCLSHWQLLDETPYLVEVHPADRASGVVSNDTTDAETVSDVDADGNPNIMRPHLTIIDETGQRRILEDDDEEDSDEEDNGDEDSDGRDDDKLVIDVDHVMPEGLADGESSPIDGLKTFDWEGVDDELKDFLGSDDDDDSSDDGDVQSNSSADASDATDDGKLTPSPSGLKRKAGDDDTVSDDSGTSALAKKQRVAKSRGASLLRSVRTPTGDEESSGLPTPQVTGDEEDVALVPEQDGDLEDELEAELMAELEQEEAAN
jgi:RNA polymerase II subunit A C-terminal domain phosphatase